MNTATSHTSYLNSVFGCDSVITTTVTVYPDYNTNENSTVCSGSSYTYPDGTVSTNIVANESHTSILISAQGCDSVITTNLSIVNSYTETANIQLCAGENYTYPDGTVSTNVVANESHVSQLLSSGGCDSIITTQLSVLPVPLTTVTENNTVLEALQNGAQYQWMDCQNNYAVIPGATQQTFTPATNGNYAVEINLGGCVDTSACLLVATINIDELSSYHLHVFPNPVGEQLEIQSNQSLVHLSYTLIDARGRIVQSSTFEKEGQAIEVSNLEEDQYTLVIDKKARVKFVKL